MKRTVMIMIALLPLLAAARPSLRGLTVEGRRSPVGLDESGVRFGWQILCGGRDVVQTDYEIIVSSTAALARRCVGDVWRSGVVRSPQSQWVGYGGPSLCPARVYFWRVRAGTSAGRSRWSGVASWSTGLLGEAHWRGRWIGCDSLMPYDSDSVHSRVAARYLRKEFAAPKKVRRATAYVCGLGVFSLFINGARVGDDVMTPVGTDYHSTVAYCTYDVTRLIRRRNAVGAVVEAGNWFAVRQHYPAAQKANHYTQYGLPTLRLNLIIEYADGSVEAVATDSTWRLTTRGPVRKANLYDGETYDARLALGPWTRPGYDDSLWLRADEMTPPRGELKGNITPAMHVWATDRPASSRRLSGHTLLDFGTNGAGRLRLRVSGRRGTVVRLRYGETLAPGDTLLYMANMRSAECTDSIICGDGPLDWTSEYVYHGFQYVEVYSDGAKVSRFRRELIADRMDDAHSLLRCYGDSLALMLNDILAAARRTIRSDFKGMPVDCPQRDERLPWLGDRTAGCTGESYMMDVRALYAKWLADICDSQRQDGALSDVSPAYWQLYRDNVSWPAALPFGASMLYRQYGDSRPAERAYPHIGRWLAHVLATNYADSLIVRGRYGDWCVPPERADLVFSADSTRTTDDAYINSLYLVSVCRMMAGWAGRFGLAGDEARYTRIAEGTLRAVNRRWLRDGCYANGTVTANLLPPAMGLVPAGSAAAVERHLTDAVERQAGGHVSCGVIGMQWLMGWLGRSRPDLAWRLATQTTYPSWGYMLLNGATTIWELWNGNTAGAQMNSGCHVMLLGDMVAWAYERVGGLSPAAPGFRVSRLAPDFGQPSLSGVDAEHATPYGTLSSRWRRRRGGRVVWTVRVPCNTSAVLRMPDGSERQVGSGRHFFELKIKN